MDSPYADELRVALGAVQAAARLSCIVLAEKDKGVVQKEDLSPVTIADFSIQAVLTATFHRAFPGDRFVGEETADDLRANPALLDRVWELVELAGASAGDEEAVCSVPRSRDELLEMIDWCGHGEPRGSGAGRVWVFDPIDGTKTFVRGEMYAINIALLEGGRQVLSVVGLPLLAADAVGPVRNDSIDPAGRGCILFAVRGHGTYALPLAGSPAPVSPQRLPRHASAVTSTHELRSVSCATLLDSGVDDVHHAATEALGAAFPGCDLLGWVPRYAALALGLANFTVWVYRRRDRLAKVWDHAGAMLLFEEVGGKITDVDGKDIDCGAGRKMAANFGFVAAPPAVHDIVLRAVQETLEKQGKGHLLVP